MRWIWIDRFVEFVSGSHARAVKNVSLAEEHLHDHYPHFAVMPGSLMLEGMAQTGGILLGEVNDYRQIVILAKVPNITFHSWAIPGDTLIYNARLINVRPEGGVVECTATVGDRLVAEAEIVFSHLDPAQAPTPDNGDGKSFVFSENTLHVLQVGKAGTRPGDTGAPPDAGS
jgi:3-hydroxyacyl-[acyl-carrier-protein] dehydratase